MGGAAPVQNAGKGRKSLDTELNLVPFIDLLSCLISFLLITAVWAQVSTLRVARPGDAPDARDADASLPIRITVTARGYLLAVGPQVEELPRLALAGGGAPYDTRRLGERLRDAKSRHRDQRAVTVAAEDAIAYDDVVAAIDAAVAADLPDVSVTGAVD